MASSSESATVGSAPSLVEPLSDGDNGANVAAVDSSGAAVVVGSDPLSDYRRKHKAMYDKRQQEIGDAARESNREKQEAADVELAQSLQQQEDQYLHTQLAADEEYFRQVQTGTLPLTTSFQEMATGEVNSNSRSEDEVRSPMRTGYAERLIDDPSLFAGNRSLTAPRNPRRQRLLGAHENASETPRWAAWLPFLSARGDEESSSGSGLNRSNRATLLLTAFRCSPRTLASLLVFVSTTLVLLVTLGIFGGEPSHHNPAPTPKPTPPPATPDMRL
eukprot:GHVT01093928.1.p1 GENE.GHVT01093928.1~~GHVT01093928.1.p1  ORF type:complete len:275 (+),score=30.84 GHVT01093928.1:209-1033(+)